MGRDGKIGLETIRWLDNEQGLSGVSTDTDDVIFSFKTPGGAVRPQRVVDGGSIFARGHFYIEAIFPERTNCNDWRYRQEIRGNAWVQRPGGARINLNHFFNQLPTAIDPINWHEDGNTGWAGVNYGHREQPGRGHNPINRYEDSNGTPNQRSGCVYKGEDYPSVTDNAIIPGDTLTLELEFKGSIYRRDAITRRLRHVKTNRWRVNGGIVV